MATCVLDDADFLFHDVLEGAVHIATVYGVSEAEVVEHARGRAARYIHDRPTQLLETLDAIAAASKAAGRTSDTSAITPPTGLLPLI
jgi:putative heme degradation protein